MRTLTNKAVAALWARKDRLFVLRHQDGRLAITAVGGVIGTLVFIDEADADDFHKNILGHSSVPIRLRRKQLREWKVETLGEAGYPDVMWATSLAGDTVRHQLCVVP